MRIIKRCPDDGQENDLHAAECAVCFGPLRYWCGVCHQWLKEEKCPACAECEAAAERVVYFYAKAGKQLGPVSIRDLERMASKRELAPNDLIWQEGTSDWIPAERLMISFPPAPPPLPKGSGIPMVPSSFKFTWPPKFLPSSGIPIRASNPAKQPALMALLSGCFPGVGQIVLGQTVKGIALLVGSIMLFGLTAGFGFIMWPISAVDAYMIASRLNQGEAVGEWDVFKSTSI